ncbi:MAG: ferrous iron transport protein B [Limnochordia bacterium]|nr:ferrous iron transport protein B [Limnochordia bacterium]MDD2630083.1 ferrous iron transport protein B [Limnochordia bacterium]
MGLTSSSTGIGALREMFEVKATPEDLVIALAGNPNTGKSTVFNSLTGLKQHTGNWPGKTVTNAQGSYTYQGEEYLLVDLPGTYSLAANSVEEEVARDFICFGAPHTTVVVTDATCLERNLNLVLQILEITPNVVVCVNLIDEAKRKQISVNLMKLSKILKVPVIGTVARSGVGLAELKGAIAEVINRHNKPHPVLLDYGEEIEKAVDILQPSVEALVGNRINARWMTLRLLEGGGDIFASLAQYLGQDLLEDHTLTTQWHSTQEYLESIGYNTEKLREQIVSVLVKEAESIARLVVTFKKHDYDLLDRRIDGILTSRKFGIPIMIGLLGIVFWLTIEGANYPSKLLADGFSWLEEQLTVFTQNVGAPPWFQGIFILGMFRTLAWVISVMLPPMAIFFPLFTLLEDLGYLPRVAFNLDNFFKRACAHGKQALTMCMGFGCNAAGVISCRIIDSPRERLIGIITNNFVPCNGRFPTLIVLASIFLAGGIFRSTTATVWVLAMVVLSVLITLFISKVLSKTVLKGLPSSFTLELPPYRKPQVGKILVRSLLDRTLFVLARAVVVAAPAGVIIWLLANTIVSDLSLLDHLAGFLQPFAHLIGLDGYILTAFILGFPANEIVIPIIIMSYMSTGALLELDSLMEIQQLFVANGWTWLTALCTMLFCLNHFPCGTTLLTIRKETQSWKWTWISCLVPTLTGIIICFIVAQTVRLLGLV